MAFEFESRIRYSETGDNQELTISALINYFQDCSTFQSESLGRGLEYLKEQKRVWMLLCWQVEILRMPQLGETVRVQTWPYDFNGFYGMRNFALCDESGAFLVKANSVWVNMDTETGRPVRITPEQVEGYGKEPKLEMEYLPRKIRTPEGCAPETAFVVRRQEIDSNQHVNNGQYVRMAEEYLPEGARVSRLRVEYRSQARLHDTIVPMVRREENQITVMLCGEDEKAYAVAEFALQR